MPPQSRRQLQCIDHKISLSCRLRGSLLVLALEVGSKVEGTTRILVKVSVKISPACAAATFDLSSHLLLMLDRSVVAPQTTGRHPVATRDNLHDIRNAQTKDIPSIHNTVKIGPAKRPSRFRISSPSLPRISLSISAEFSFFSNHEARLIHDSLQSLDTQRIDPCFSGTFESIMHAESGRSVDDGDTTK